MTTSRPLRDVLGEDADRLAGDRQATLGEAGHPDLPDALVAEAIVSYADTAPHEIAEHLAPFVSAHGAVPAGQPAGSAMDLSHGLRLLATAPAGVDGGATAERPVEEELAGAADVDLDRLGADHSGSGHTDPGDANPDGSAHAGMQAEPVDHPAIPDFGGGAAVDAQERPDGLTATQAPSLPPVTDGTEDEQFPLGSDVPFLDALDEQVADGSEPDGDDIAGF